MKNLLVAALLGLGMVACGGPSQSADCAKWVNCYNAMNGTTGMIDGTYGPNGTCWTSTQDWADGCTSTCKANLAAEDLNVNVPGLTVPAACQ